VRWAATYVCDGRTTETCEQDLDAFGCKVQKETCTEWFGDTCIRKDIDKTCYTEAPTLCSSNPDCVLTDTRCLSYTNGLCDSQEQIYSCGTVEQVCVKSREVNTCMGTELTHGLNEFTDTANAEGFGQVAGYLAILDEMQRTAEEGMIDIFPGKSLRCHKPVLDGTLTNNCCDRDLKDEGGEILEKCDAEEIELAAARRAQRTRYIGSWCSSDSIVGCLEKTQRYCAFPSVLARVIQEQGRLQLAELAQSGFANAELRTVNFPYLAGAGGWLALATVNGNDVRAWQWPQYCQDAESAQAAYDADPAVAYCPAQREVWFTTCAKAEGCGTLPAYAGALSSGDWEVQRMEPARAQTSGISRYVSAAGQCDAAGACQYDLAAWPAGSGGDAMLALELSFPFFADEAGYSVTGSEVGNFAFRGHTFAFGEQPTAVPVQVATNAGSGSALNWQTFDLPLTIQGVNYALATSPTVTVYGGCEALSNLCTYRFSMPMSVSAKSWGSPKSPDCSGFTPAQLAVMDFGKMDFGEWLSSSEFDLPDTGAQADRVQGDISVFYDTYTAGETATAGGPSEIKSARLWPTEGVGEFTVSMEAVANWPQWFADGGNDDRVSQVSVNWGDGSPSAAASYTETGSGPAFLASHTYARSASAVTTHTVTVTLVSASGTHSVTASVQAYRDTPAPSTSSQGGGNSGDINYTPSSFPGGVDGNTVP